MSLTAGTHTITALPDGAKGLSYAAPALNATGGTGTYRWTRTTGNLTRGQTVTYTVTVTNTGPAKAAGVQVGAAFTGLNTTGVTYNPTAGRSDGTRTIPVLGSSLNGTWWTLPTAMNAGETRTFTITGTIATTMKGKAPTVLAGASTTTPETNLPAYLNNTGRWTGTEVQ